MRKKVLYVIIIIFYCCSSCTETKIKRTILDWKKDEIGCLGLRLDIFNNNLGIISSEFLGKSNNNLTNLLGKPNEILDAKDGKLYSYFVAPGNQCTDNSFDDQIDVLRLAFKVKKNKVVDIHELQP